MNKDTTPHSLSDPEIQEAISNADSTFDKLSNRYDSVSKDINLTEKYLDGKDVKSTFAFNFGRIEDMYTGDGSDDYPGWDPEEFGHETLDWRKDPVSNRYRLMVSLYQTEFLIKYQFF